VTLAEAAALVPDFASSKHIDKIRFFCWHLHAHRGLATIQPADVRTCFEELHLDPPASVSPFFKSLTDRRPKELLKNASGYRLEQRVRQEFDGKYGRRQATVHVEALLTSLLPRIGNADQRTYLEETMTCFRHRAFRASVVMAWNLAYDHVCNVVLAKHLAAFNAQLPLSFPKADILTITRRNDFTVLRETQVLQVCKSANIITNALFKNLSARLDKRNAAAHPSGVAVTQLTAEEFISDVIENVVLRL
jgi:hypothetical protein